MIPEFTPDIDTYTGAPELHDVFTITLYELIESGVFDWSKEYLDWSGAAYDETQYERICTYFIERFRFREISIVPFLEWAYMLRRKLIYELMPKYRPMYNAIAAGINPLAESDEYHKRRTINSDFPETLLSGNSDYASAGTDEEYETIRLANITERMTQYQTAFKSTDEALLDELEPMFYSMYSSYVNGL